MALLSKSDAEEVRKIFSSLEKDVHLRVYTQKNQCTSCSDTEAILRELDHLSDRLKITFLKSQADGSEMKADQIKYHPAIVVSDGEHGRVRFYGAPSGYEFSSLLTAIVDQGTGSEPLNQKTVDFLDELTTDLDIKVFVTPTCPHCPSAAVLACRMARHSSKVNSAVIEANEFTDLSGKYGVQGVPRTVINDIYFVEGSLSESMMVKSLQRALKDNPSAEMNLLSYLEEDQ